MLDQLPCYVMALNSMGGILFLSGFYNDDLSLIIKTAENLGLCSIEKKEKDDWCALKLIKWVIIYFNKRLTIRFMLVCCEY